MNHNNQVRAARLTAETETFYRLPRIGQTKVQIVAYRDEIESIGFSLPAEYASCLLILLDGGYDEIILSHQDKLRFEKLLREWKSLAEAHKADTRNKLERIAAIIRPVIEELYREEIGLARASAQRLRNKRSKQVEHYRSEICEFKAQHPEFATEAEEALKLLPAPNSLPNFECDAADQPIVVDPTLLLKPLKENLDSAGAAYEQQVGELALAAWQAWLSLPKCETNV